MQVCSRVFFSSLSVDARYYTKVFLSFGVKSSFIFDKDDLQLIINNVRKDRYKSVMVVKRATDLLGGLK